MDGAGVAAFAATGIGAISSKPREAEAGAAAGAGVSAQHDGLKMDKNTCKISLTKQNIPAMNEVGVASCAAEGIGAISSKPRDAGAGAAAGAGVSAHHEG